MKAILYGLIIAGSFKEIVKFKRIIAILYLTKVQSTTLRSIAKKSSVCSAARQS